MGLKIESQRPLVLVLTTMIDDTMLQSLSGSPRPMAKVRRIGLISREVKERIGSVAIELLLEACDIVSEGQEAVGNRYFGSTMMTIVIEKLSSVFRDAGDVRVPARVAQLLQHNPAALKRIEGIARSEATRIAGAELVFGDVDIRVRSSNSAVHIDIDLEASTDRVPLEHAG